MMKNIKVALCGLLLIAGCTMNEQDTDLSAIYLTDQLPGLSPEIFKPGLVAQDELIHRGIFSPDMNAYYYTVSDKEYKNFEVRVIQKSGQGWSEPKPAFFNSSYNEHGMSFSPDGQTLYFSSTRPAGIGGVADTWHLWKTEQKEGQWSEPEFIDIPGLRGKLVSHPTVTQEGTLYFHVSNTDYSDMDIFYSKKIKGTYQQAEKLQLIPEVNTAKCTPYISPEGDYLIYATIGEQLDLEICYKKEGEVWHRWKKLPEHINDSGQGNPYISPDGRFLFYAHVNPQSEWNVKWVKTDSFINP